MWIFTGYATHANAAYIQPNSQDLTTCLHEARYCLLNTHAYFQVDIRDSDRIVFDITR